MEEHKTHNDSKCISEAILNFYEEHKHFVIPILYLNESGELDFHLQTPVCYKLKCDIQYTLEEIKEALKDPSMLTSDLNTIKEALDNCPEFKDTIIEKLDTDDIDGKKKEQRLHEQKEKERQLREEEEKNKGARKIEYKEKVNEFTKDYTKIEISIFY